MAIKKNTIAVLMTCHNRRDKTIECLDLLFKNDLLDNIILNVFLVDDGSTDGTESAVKEKFPQVKLIKGNGFLFWNQGMRLAWDTAVKYSDYDFYIWLNDDTLLDKNAINELLKCHIEAIDFDGKAAIITGTCRESISSFKFSYGGRSKNENPILPNGKLQECVLINGNIVLIPKLIFKNIGNLSPDYTHAIGDNDYGLTAVKNGFKCYITKNYIASCQINRIPKWFNPEFSLKERLYDFYSPVGLNIKEYIIYRKKFWNKKWIYFFIIAYAKVLFPATYENIRRHLN